MYIVCSALFARASAESFCSMHYARERVSLLSLLTKCIKIAFCER